MQVVVLAVAYPTCCLRIVDIGRVMSRTWVVRWYSYSSSGIQIGAPHSHDRLRERSAPPPPAAVHQAKPPYLRSSMRRQARTAHRGSTHARSSECFTCSNHSHINRVRGYRSSTWKYWSRPGNAESFSSPPCKTSHKDRIMFLDPVPRPHWSRIWRNKKPMWLLGLFCNQYLSCLTRLSLFLHSA